MPISIPSVFGKGTLLSHSLPHSNDWPGSREKPTSLPFHPFRSPFITLSPQKNPHCSASLHTMSPSAFPRPISRKAKSSSGSKALEVVSYTRLESLPSKVRSGTCWVLRFSTGGRSVLPSRPLRRCSCAWQVMAVTHGSARSKTSYLIRF